MTELDAELESVRTELAEELAAADAQRRRVARLLQRVDLLATEHRREIAKRDAEIERLKQTIETLKAELNRT
jgi:chromosome segregation ATPase